MYSNPTGNNIISYVRGDIGLYYMWVLFEVRNAQPHSLHQLLNMRVAPEESCTSTGATRSAVDAGRVSKRGTKRAKPANEKTETLKACVAALNTTLKELGSASTTTTTDSLVDPELARWAEKEKKLQEVNIAHAQANQETQSVLNSLEKSIAELGAWLESNPHVDGEPQYDITRLRGIKTQRLEGILQTAESAAAMPFTSSYASLIRLSTHQLCRRRQQAQRPVTRDRPRRLWSMRNGRQKMPHRAKSSPNDCSIGILFDECSKLPVKSE